MESNVSEQYGGAEQRGESEQVNVSEQVALYQQNHEIALRNRIVLDCMKLVRTCVLSMRNMFVKFGSVNDVINEGVIALMDAIDSYSPEYGAKFETYASLKIRGAVIDFIRRQDWVPRNIRKFARELDKASSMLYNLNGRVASTDELADYLKMDKDKLMSRMAECSGAVTLSFEELLYEDNINEPQMTDNSDARLLQDELKALIAEAIGDLKERERQVITLYYYKNFKYSDIAKALGLTEGRVCQIHTKAILGLKAKLGPYFKGEC